MIFLKLMDFKHCSFEKERRTITTALQTRSAKKK
jgi:hypothetical protein